MKFFKKILLFLEIVILVPLVLSVILLAFGGVTLYWGAQPNTEIIKQDNLVVTTEGEASFFKPKEIRTMTYDIGYGAGSHYRKDLISFEESQANMNKIAQIITTDKTDIVFLQEADISSARSHFKNQIEFLAQTCGLPYYAIIVDRNKTYVPLPKLIDPKTHFGQVISGQAILTRFPIKSHTFKRLDPVESMPWYEKIFRRDQIIQVANLQVAEGLDVQVAHFSVDRSTATNLTTTIKTFHNFIESNTTPETLIVGGHIGNDLSLFPMDQLPIEKVTSRIQAELKRLGLQTIGSEQNRANASNFIWYRARGYQPVISQLEVEQPSPSPFDPFGVTFTLLADPDEI